MKPSSRFKSLIDAGDGDAELVPVLTSYLEGGQLPDPFKLKVRGGKGDVPPDDWFHPSTHPLMTDRQLYYYLTQPELWFKEPFGYQGRVSTLMGSISHEIFETALKDLGYLVPPKGICLACGLPQPSKCRENGVIDQKTRSRGHVDGILHYDGRIRHFELKTSNPFSLKGVRNNDVELFRIKWPKYYAQAQEYLRMSGLRESVILFFEMSHPWVMREFHVEFDLEFSEKIRHKYLAVREAVTKGVPPMACCSRGSSMAKKCPAMACEVKLG